MKQVLAALTILLGLSSISHAGMLLEPYVGYESGNLNYKPVNGVDLKDSLTATGFGLRLGYKFLLPWVALDYTSTSGTDKRDSSLNIENPGTTHSSLGAVVGVDLPLFLRFWGGYGLSNELATKATSTILATKFKGSYLKLGAGLKIIPFTSLNLEYIMNKYTRYDNGVTEGDIGNTFSSTSNDTLMLSISVPFNL